MTTAASAIQRRLAAAGALLFAIGIVTGLWSAAALTGKVVVPIPHLALAAHLNGILGGLWLLAVAFTFPFLRYGERGLGRLAVVAALPAWANWLITTLASLLGVRGIELTGVRQNDLVAVLLDLFVVMPTLVAVVAWAWGFRRAKP